MNVNAKIQKVLLLFLMMALMLCLMGSVSTQSADGVRPGYSGEQVYERTHEAVFYVRALSEDGLLNAAGTGFFVTPEGYALTAAHVIRDASSVNVELESGRVYKNVSVVYSDAATDLAVLKPSEPEKKFSYIPLSEASPAYGAALYAIGYPLKTTKIFTDGMVSAPEAPINGNDQMLMTVSLANGMSGGPILNEYGYAVGVSSGTLRTMSGISVSPTTEQIQKMLKAVITEG
jgi:S1-C subfamily serine protease